MQGRLERSIRSENNIDILLRELPHFVTDYYYSFKQGRQPKACLEYIRKIKKFLEYVNPDTKSITIDDLNSTILISKYLDSISTVTKNGNKVEASVSYQQQNYSILNSLYTYLFDEGYFERNPMSKIKRTRGKDNVQRTFLKERDLKKILRAAEIDRQYANIEGKLIEEAVAVRNIAMLMLFMETGMREGALSEINVEDVDLDEKTVSVINKGHKPYVYRIDDKLVNAISEWIEMRPVLLKDVECDALFVSLHKQRVETTTVIRVVQKYSMKALGKEVSPHKLRAAFANIVMRNSNGNIYLAQSLLDHQSPNTTRIYLEDISEQDKEDASRMVSRLVFGKD